MATVSLKHSHRSARLLLLLLVAVPLLPEIFVWMAALLANIKGCHLIQEGACEIKSQRVSELIDWGLAAGGVISLSWRSYFHLVIGGWLAVCYVVLIRGWERVTSRLLLGSAVALFFAVLASSGPLFAIRMVAGPEVCKPESFGCLLFGGQVKNAYGAIQNANLAVLNGDNIPIVAVFVVFAILVIAIRATSARRRVNRDRALHL